MCKDLIIVTTLKRLITEEMNFIKILTGTRFSLGKLTASEEEKRNNWGRWILREERERRHKNIKTQYIFYLPVQKFKAIRFIPSIGEYIERNLSTDTKR
jgi:hypothetical protein